MKLIIINHVRQIKLRKFVEHLRKKSLEFKYFVKNIPFLQPQNYKKYFYDYWKYGYHKSALKRKSLTDIRNSKFIKYLSGNILQDTEFATFEDLPKVSRPPLKVLFTIHELHARGGVEMWLKQMVIELKTRGVEVLVYTGNMGELANRINLLHGVEVTSDISKAINFNPDVLHLHHHPCKSITALIKRLDKKIPIFNLVHGVAPYLEMPYLDNSRTIFYGGVSKLVAQKVSFLTGKPPSQIYLLKNFTKEVKNSTKYSYMHSKSALVSSKVNNHCIDILTALLKTMSIGLDVYGGRVNKEISSYSKIIDEYDFFFCTGKTAIDIMGFGKPVILLEECLLGPAVVNENIVFLSDMNFALASHLVDAVDLENEAAAHALAIEINKIKNNNIQGNLFNLPRENELGLATDRLTGIYYNLVDQALLNSHIQPQ